MQAILLLLFPELLRQHLLFGGNTQHIRTLCQSSHRQAVLQLLPSTAKYYFTKASIPRALDEQELLKQAQELGLTGSSFSDVNSAIKAAKENADFNDLILVCGSVFVIAEVNQNQD